MREGQIFILMIVCLVAGWGLAAWVRRYAKCLRLVSIPNHRSSHVEPTPHGGGLGIVVGGLLSGIWLAWQQGTAVPMVVTGLALLIATMGLIDDIRHLSVRLRFGVQVIACAIMIMILEVITWSSDVAVVNLSTEILLAGILLVAGVWWINLFNFMDGIDGIAGVEAVSMLLGGSLLAVISNPQAAGSPNIIWMLAIAAGTIGFLSLNWPPARIFMGDVGSTFLAFMIFAFVLLTVRENGLSYPGWLILAAVFVSDATVTLLRRMLVGQRWFEAHRSHAYQRLARRFGSHGPVTLTTLAINLIWLLPLAWLSQQLPAWSWEISIVAYAPLLVGAWRVGAGSNEHA